MDNIKAWDSRLEPGREGQRFTGLGQVLLLPTNGPKLKAPRRVRLLSLQPLGQIFYHVYAGAQSTISSFNT